MKTLRQLSAVAILSLTLAVSVMAGQIDTWGIVAPPPPPTTTTTTQTTTSVAGQIETMGAPEQASTTTAIVLTVLSLIYR